MKRLKHLVLLLALFSFLAIATYAESPPFLDDTEVAVIELAPPVEQEVPAEQEPPAYAPVPDAELGSDTSEPQTTDPVLIALAGTVSDLSADVRALLTYVEFFIYGILPLAICITLIIAGCIWFRKTFVTL